MHPLFEHLHVIANPASGSRKPVRETISALLEGYGGRWSMSITEVPGDGRRLAQEAAAAGADVIAVYGGDGTIASVVDGLAGLADAENSGVPLAILPGGTANILARELGIPRRLRDAARLITGGEHTLRALDRGKIGDRSFLIRAGVGFEAAVIENTAQPLKNLFGPFGYGIGAIQALRPRLAARFSLTLDGQPIEASGFNVWIANAGSIGRLGLVFSRQVRPDDGLLDVILVSLAPQTLLATAASAVRLERWAKGLRRWQASEIVIEADPPQPVQGDGEPFGQTPVSVTVQPGAVQVVVPRLAVKEKNSS